MDWIKRMKKTSYEKRKKLKTTIKEKNTETEKQLKKQNRALFAEPEQDLGTQGPGKTKNLQSLRQKRLLRDGLENK